MSSEVYVIVTAHNEAAGIGRTLSALARTFPGAALWVADDGSTDATAQLAAAAGAHVARAERRVGKGAAATRAARAALARLQPGGDAVAVLCDGDLGESAGRLGALAAVVQRGEGDLAVAAFARRIGGGFGVAAGFARWAIRRRCGLELRAPISGQRALRSDVLRQTLPFAPGFGMEIGMTIDAARAGRRIVEVELDLTHRASTRTPSGFVHRGRQLVDFVRVYLARR